MRIFATSRKRLLKRLFYISVAFNLPRCCGIVLACLTRKINNEGQNTILYFGSAASFNDIDALIRYSGKNRYIYIQRWYFGHVLSKYVPYSDLKETNYHHEEEYRDGLKKANIFLGKLFSTFRMARHFDAVMTSNIGFKEQQEVLSICKDRGIPIIILYREGLGNSYIVNQYIKGWAYRKATCDLFICHNELIKETLIRNNVPGLDSNAIKVCGIPRIDMYARNVQCERKRRLTYFTYETEVKFAKYVTDEKVLRQAEKRTQEFTESVYRLAKERNDIEVLIKTKPSGPKLKAAWREAEAYFGGGGLPENLNITYEGFAEDLILGSAWVLCISNSTILLEGLVADRPVACPYFDDILGSGDWDLLQEEKYIVDQIRGYEDLVEFIERGGKEFGKGSRVQGLLEGYLYKTDGLASMRVEEEIGALIEGARGRACPERV